MTGNEISALLRFVGSGITKIAQKRGDKHITRVSNVVYYITEDEEIRACIAEIFGLPVNLVFNHKPCTSTILRKIKLVNSKP